MPKLFLPIFPDGFSNRALELSIFARILGSFKDVAGNSWVSSILALGLFGKVEPMLCNARMNFTSNFAAIFFRNGQKRLINP